MSGETIEKMGLKEWIEVRCVNCAIQMRLGLGQKSITIYGILNPLSANPTKWSNILN